VLDAVAEAPPPAFSGGGKWEAMHDEMAGFYEVRIQGGGMNQRSASSNETPPTSVGRRSW